MGESENTSSETPSRQTFSGFIFGIALGSDLPAAVKDFQAFSNTTNTNTGGQSVGPNLAGARASFVLSTTAAGTGLSARHGGSTAIDNNTTKKTDFYRMTTPKFSISEVERNRRRYKRASQNIREARAFGANTTGNTGGLFGGTSQANTGTSSFFTTTAAGTGFGARPGGFTGFGTCTGQTDSSLFKTNTGATSSLFGQTSATGAFGGASASIAAVGTTVPFNPPNDADTMMNSGVTTNINTKHQCITAMKEYENKSLDELRMGDYSANRKSKQAGSTSTVGLFGQAPST